jgi:hypothetical protein
MIFPATIKGYKVNNEDELHELVDIDMLTPDEYSELVNTTDVEAEEALKKNKRKSYKKLYLEAKEDCNYWFKRFKQMENKCEDLARELLFAKGKKEK